MAEGDVTITIDPTEPLHQPKENVPAPGSPRWEEVYGKMKQYERDKAKLEEKMESLSKAAADYPALLEHNQKLAEAIDKLSASIDVKAGATDGGIDPLKSIEAEMKEVREKKAEALKLFDYTLANELDEKLDELRDKKVELKTTAKNAPAGIDPEAQRAMDQFIKDNPWFIKDPNLNAIAVGIDGTLVNDPVWKTKPVAERYAETARRVKEFTGMETKKGDEHKEDDKNKAGAGVEGSTFRVGGDSAQAGGKLKVTLTARELEAAKFTGVSPEAYAKQKAALEKAGRI